MGSSVRKKVVNERKVNGPQSTIGIVAVIEM